MDWFTTEQIDEITWAISEYGHDEETHAYLLLGTKEALLIDTGMGIEDIHPIVKKLTDLPIRVLTTHAHWDHIGSHSSFQMIGIEAHEVEWLNHFPLPIHKVREEVLKTSQRLPDDFDITKYRIYQGGATYVVHNGEQINLGDRQLEIIHTPGHSPGSICIYEPATRYLFSGDLIYEGELDAYYPSTNPNEYLKSLEKLQELPISMIFGGHHRLFFDPDILHRAYLAFVELKKTGLLHHGTGIHYYGDFSIRL